MTTAIRHQHRHQQELFASAGILVILMTAIAFGVAILQRLPYLQTAQRGQARSAQEQVDLRMRLDSLEQRVSRIESRLVRNTETPADQSLRLPGSNRSW